MYVDVPNFDRLIAAPTTTVKGLDHLAKYLERPPDS
jgi:hypothetical protein